MTTGSELPAIDAITLSDVCLHEYWKEVDPIMGAYCKKCGHNVSVRALQRLANERGFKCLPARVR